MTRMLRLGEKIEMKGRRMTVTQKTFDSLQRARDHLVDAAQAGITVTYGQLVADLDLPYLPRGLGRFLDILSEDCLRRDEPSLAAIVVNDNTGEVRSDFAGAAARERAAVFSYWSRP